MVESWSASLEGLNLTKSSKKDKKSETTQLSRWILFFPIIFYVRRIVFIAFALYYVNAQSVLLHLEIFFSFAASIAISVLRPYMTRLANNLEIFNEMTVIILYGSIINFTDAF